MSSDRHTLLNQIRKEFGEQSMFLLGETERLDIKVRSSGSLLLDLALGGGYPHGRVIELNGKEKSGKTTLLNLAIAEAQRVEPDKECAIIDLEHSYNPEWAKKLGVDVDRLFITQPDTYAEKIYEMIEYLVKTGRFSIIGLDSVAGLVPKEEMENDDYEKESRVGGNSKLNAKAIRKIVNSGILTKSGTTLIFINQLRDKIGAFSMYGTPTDTPGGRALKHGYSQVLEVSTSEYFTKGSGDSKVVLGQQTKIKVSKNKIAPPFRTATIDLYYEYGMDRVMELVKVAKEIGVLNGSSWLTFMNPLTGEIFTDENGKEIKFNGVNKAREALNEDIQFNNAELYTKLFNVVQEVIRG
jgi:recombination protein RecA